MKLFPKCRDSYQRNMEKDKTEKKHEDRKDKNALSNEEPLLTSDEDDSEQEQKESQNERQKDSSNKRNLYIFGVIIIGITAAFLKSDYVSALRNVLHNCTYNNNTALNISHLEKKYPLQTQELFGNIEIILNDVLQLEDQRPAVFLLLYMQNNGIINDLVHDLASYASKKFETCQDYIELNETEFYSDEATSDYGFLIHKYKPDLEKRAIMVVKEIQNIPAHVAQIFHSFCDDESPLVGRAVYIFTMKVNSFAAKEELIAENHLKENWKNLHNDILIPLITRVTATVLKIYS